MAFSDPISMTVNAVAKSMPRITMASNGAPSVFKMNDDEFKTEIAHQSIKSGRRERHVIKVTQRKITADPYVPATNVENTASVHIVVENPVTGFTDVELGYIVSALCTFVTNAGNQAKFLGSEA